MSYPLAIARVPSVCTQPTASLLDCWILIISLPVRHIQPLKCSVCVSAHLLTNMESFRLSFIRLMWLKLKRPDKGNAVSAYLALNPYVREWVWTLRKHLCFVDLKNWLELGKFSL